jgi:steroid 5-alpha reductase family enzyme
MNAPVVATRPYSGFAIVGFAYVVALVVASAVVHAMVGVNPLWVLAAADTAATITVFVFSRAFNNTSVYDPYWSLVPIPVAVYFWAGPAAGMVEPLELRQVAVLVLVSAYGLRLTWNWIRGWPGLQHEDWRYADFRKKTGKAYWLVSFSALHFFPTVMTYLGCLPLQAAMGSGVSFGALDVVAVIVTAGAITIEGVADNQLRAFRQQHPSGDICDVGLWKYSRHPNYFGEIAFWLGLLLFGLAAGAPAWTSVGFVAMVVLFVGASIPMAEKRSLERRPHYAEHQKKVSMLVPWVPKA